MEGQEELRFHTDNLPSYSKTGTVLRKNKDGTRTAVNCPLAVKLYNEHMGSVDLADC